MNVFFDIRCPFELIHVATDLIKEIKVDGLKDIRYESIRPLSLNPFKPKWCLWNFGWEEKLGYWVEYLGECDSSGKLIKTPKGQSNDRADLQ